MAKKTRFRSLTLKLLGMLVASALVSVALYLLCGFVGQQIVTKVWLSPIRTQSRIKEHVQSFRAFVDEQDISSTDAASVGRWSREHPDVRLTVHGRNTVISADSYGAEITLSDSGLSLRLDDRENYPYTVNFSDGSYTVNMYDHSDNRLYNIVNITAIVLSTAVFLLLMLLYERHVTYSILRLSRQVRQVSRGSLQLRLQSSANDEIGQLAEDVEAMRLSILDKLRREEEALQANTDLITAISHDVRTPLTALLGYLDVLSDPELPEDIQRTYLDICRNNALRLKDLTDELFGFFLVFGKQTPEQTPEVFDAAMLLEQILLEAQAELTGQGFNIRMDWPEELTGMLQIDLNHLRRVFDNLFSNVRKYADPQKDVVIRISADGEMLRIAITNAILSGGSRVESNKIGLKTCDKLLKAMGGSFRQASGPNGFTAEVILPFHHAE